jgi:hypothetical protein
MNQPINPFEKDTPFSITSRKLTKTMKSPCRSVPFGGNRYFFNNLTKTDRIETRLDGIRAGVQDLIADLDAR